MSSLRQISFCLRLDIWVLGVTGYIHISLGGLSTLVWVLACLLFVCNVMLTLSIEKNEFNAQSAFLVILMLLTYSKLWVVVVLKAIYLLIKLALTKKQMTWYKTERSAE